MVKRYREIGIRHIVESSGGEFVMYSDYADLLRHMKEVSKLRYTDTHWDGRGGRHDVIEAKDFDRLLPEAKEE